MTREASNAGKLKLNPHSIEPITKTIVPILKIRIFPTISPSFPKKRIAAQIAIKYPVVTHSICAIGSFNCFDNSGRAMLTILPSSVDMKVKIFRTIKIIQRFF
ncbi:hypothetical protein D3C78_1536220 [compost metagenome]